MCGGTHVAHSAQIRSLALTGDSSVGAGQRRIEAITGIEAFRYLARERDLVGQLAAQLKARPEELPDRVATLLSRMKPLTDDAQRAHAFLLLTELALTIAALAAVD
ncbi:hypothetical protein [Micromonospora endophytica]|uniref:hypothetical protein n=1 Tax=Micromonospora endophytica TaxID=515350 RepID=UPI002017E7D9|nr:hypothetical protein [Micromonospora endophytica]